MPPFERDWVAHSIQAACRPQLPASCASPTSCRMPDQFPHDDGFRRSTHQPFCPPACRAIPAIILACASSSSTSLTLVPLPRATRLALRFKPKGLPALSKLTCALQLDLTKKAGMWGSHEYQPIRIQLVRPHGIGDEDHPLQLCCCLAFSAVHHTSRHPWYHLRDLRQRSPSRKSAIAHQRKKVAHMLIMLDSCSRQSRMENLPCSSFFARSFCRSGFALAMSCL